MHLRLQGYANLLLKVNLLEKVRYKKRACNRCGLRQCRKAARAGRKHAPPIQSRVKGWEVKQDAKMHCLQYNPLRLNISLNLKLLMRACRKERRTKGRRRVSTKQHTQQTTRKMQEGKEKEIKEHAVGALSNKCSGRTGRE
eukprot:scaffold70089_cov19-Tisochrysis_lutea.AAC.1